MVWRIIYHLHTLLSIGVVTLLAGGVSQWRPEPLRVADDTGYELTPPFFRFVTAGHWTAAVDYFWIRTLQFAGGIQKKSPQAMELARFYRLAQKLDPDFFETYLQGGLIFGALLDEPELALEVLDRGIRVYESGRYPKAFWPYPFQLYIYRAFVNAFLREDFQEARQDFLNAAKVPGAPAYLSQGWAKISSPDADRMIALHVLRQMIQNEKDPELRKKYEEKLKTYER
jgi:hypothetical protein